MHHKIDGNQQKFWTNDIAAVTPPRLGQDLAGAGRGATSEQFRRLTAGDMAM